MAYVVCAVVWGTTWFAIRVCIGDGGYPVMEAAALRFAIATAVLIPLIKVLRIRELPRSRAQWGWLAFAGVLDALGYSLVYLGETRVPGGLAAVLYGVQPLVLAVLLAMTKMEPVRPGAVIGALISIAGVAMLSVERASVSTQQLIGVALVLGSARAHTSGSRSRSRGSR